LAQAVGFAQAAPMFIALPADHPASSIPIPLRLLFAAQPKLVTPVLQVAPIERSLKPVHALARHCVGLHCAQLRKARLKAFASS